MTFNFNPKNWFGDEGSLRFCILRITKESRCTGSPFSNLINIPSCSAQVIRPRPGLSVKGHSCTAITAESEFPEKSPQTVGFCSASDGERPKSVRAIGLDDTPILGSVGAMEGSLVHGLSGALYQLLVICSVRVKLRSIGCSTSQSLKNSFLPSEPLPRWYNFWRRPLLCNLLWLWLSLHCGLIIHKNLSISSYYRLYYIFISVFNFVNS